MRHLISLLDFSADEIRRILEIGRGLKLKLKNGDRSSALQRHVMGMLFEKPSLRTRVSFESLMGQLGGTSLFLGPDVGWGTREPIQDFMPILTSYLDVLVIRAKNHQDVVDATQYSQCPIINGLTDVSHPCQALADVMTVWELSHDFSNTKIAYLGDSNNVAYSLAVICSKIGIRLSIASPNGYQFDDAFIDQLNGEAGGDIIEKTSTASTAVQGAEFVYTDVWTSMGQEADDEKRIRDFAEFQVNSEILKSARQNARLLHCLPARRGQEVTAEIIDSPISAVIDQAENRLHAQKGLVVWLLTEAEDPNMV